MRSIIETFVNPWALTSERPIGGALGAAVEDAGLERTHPMQGNEAQTR